MLQVRLTTDFSIAFHLRLKSTASNALYLRLENSDDVTFALRAAFYWQHRYAWGPLAFMQANLLSSQQQIQINLAVLQNTKEKSRQRNYSLH